jgi:hypothetical protein
MHSRSQYCAGTKMLWNETNSELLGKIDHAGRAGGYQWYELIWTGPGHVLEAKPKGRLISNDTTLIWLGKRRDPQAHLRFVLSQVLISLRRQWKNQRADVKRSGGVRTASTFKLGTSKTWSVWGLDNGSGPDESYPSELTARRRDACDNVACLELTAGNVFQHERDYQLPLLL